jgi:hypothetical protein
MGSPEEDWFRAELQLRAEALLARKPRPRSRRSWLQLWRLVGPDLSAQVTTLDDCRAPLYGQLREAEWRVAGWGAQALCRLDGIA